ncbi:MAG: chromosome segregation protein SMC [Synergistaceae bacterium]|nr:chromosome segregation protein SMC [Synergistaceae bacterium]
MSIEYLRLKGFKSFGASCEFSFSEGLTAIVGPNGSGKSNILDALRWVLGESSPSVLRIQRQSDLIFQGSATVNPSKEAEVALRLRQKEDAATLCRQYSTEGGSVLLVDSTRIRLQDLNDFKDRFTLSGDSFAFIGQGEVSEVIHQRPMERRRHLELLFGIDRYRKRREETYLRLASAMTEMQRINTLVAELEKRREEIAPEVAIAVEAKGILDNLENVRRDFYFSRRLSLEKKDREDRSRLQSMAEHEDLAARWRALWRAATTAAEERLRRGGFDEQDFLVREQDLTGRREALRRQCFSAATRIRGILSDRASLGAEVERAQNTLQTVESELQKTEHEETALRADLDTKRAAFEEMLRRIEEGRANAERERARLQALQDGYAGRALLRSQREARLRALSSSQERSGEELLRLAAEREPLAATIAKLEGEIVALEKRHEGLSVEYADVYAACQKYAALLQQMKRELVTRQAELDATRENTESSIYPEPTRVLLSASRLGKMASHPEVVAEAFSCPPEVTPALEAYLGGRQFWLLVHTFDEAQEGIELLKQRRAGRVTYLPLERCRPRFPDAGFRLPAGAVGWGIELVVPRSPWEPALQHLLGDLLVVRDYALGSGMVKNGARFPIVTLEGEVFAPSGTVSGGRTRQSGGAISHNQRVAELAAQTDALRRKIGDAGAELAGAEKREQKAAMEREELGLVVARSRSELQAARRAFEGLNADVARIESEKNSSLAEMEAIRGELLTLDAEIAEFEEQLSELRGREPGDGEMPSFAGVARGEMDLIEERLRGAVNMLTRIRRERDDLEGRVAVIKTELEAGRSEEKDLRLRLSDMGRQQLALRNEIEDLRARLEEERGRVRREHDRQQRVRAREQKAEAALVALRAEIAALTERVASTRSEIEQMREMWDEKYPYDVEEAARIEDVRDLPGMMRRLERELRALGSYSLGALSEDESLTERVDYLTEQLEDVKTGVGELEALIAETDLQVDTLFTQAMTDIDNRFNALFQRLFAGGEAKLRIQEGNPDAAGTIWDRGVEIYARPPGRHLQNISQLSGGERSLTAIAHLFAALEVARMPLAVLDEVDAALDEYNLIRFADLAKEYSKRLQLLVITHRRTTMEHADLIYGVTMVEPGLSKIVGIDVENYK